MIEAPDEFPLPERAYTHHRPLIGARVATQRRPQRSRRRGPVVVVAVASALGVLLVSPAFGVGGRLWDLINQPPAPPDVQKHFAVTDALREQRFAQTTPAERELQDRFSRLVAGGARALATIESADGAIYLWAAPTEDGRQCWLIQTAEEPGTRRPLGSGSCDSLRPTGVIQVGTIWTVDRPSVAIVHARVYDATISRVDVEVEGAPTIALSVIAGHALGTVAKEARVVAVVGRKADGDEVARVLLR